MTPLMSRSLRQFDWPIFLSVLALVGIGLAFVTSASLSSPEAYASHFHNLPKRQALFFGVGIAAFVIALIPNYRFWGRLSYAIYLIGIFFLLLLFVLGRPRGGAVRWLSLGGFSLQPSEFVKVAYILVLAWYLKYRNDLTRFSGLLTPLALAAVPALLILKQPNLGTALLFAPIFFVMVYLAGARPRHLLGLITAAISLVPVLWWLDILKPHQKERIRAFLNWTYEPLGSGYQIRQSLIAIGSGGFWGKGWGEGLLNRLNYLPHHHNDFIFGVIAEEWGFWGTSLVLLLYGLIILGGLSIAGRTKEPFGRLLAAGISTLFLSQVLVNIGMTLGLLPVTGLTLPFVSYGGSSMVSSFIAIGLLLNISMRREVTFSSRDFR